MSALTQAQTTLDRLSGGAHGAAGAMPWLAKLRAEAGARFAEAGLPTPRLESWKYTNLRPLEKLDFAPSASTPISIDRLPSLLPKGQAAQRLVFVNGQYRADLSVGGDLPPGVEVGSLAEALARGDSKLADDLGHIAQDDLQLPLMDLNTANLSDGFLLRVGPGVRLDLPIEVVYLGAAPQGAQAFHPRGLIVMGEGSQAIVVEHHDGIDDGAYFANHVCEIRIGAKAALRHYAVQAESPAAIHLASVHTEVGADGVYDSFVMARGGRLSRRETRVRLAAPGAECHVNGVYMLRGEQHCDNTTIIDHLAPDTASREVFKGVIDERARGVFQGKIVVHPKAQKSDGHQLSRALLLSDSAEIDAKPELEIYADDVKCSHGATAGDIDREALFYLRTRGIGEEAARHMLIEAFLSDTINSLAAEGLCPALMSSVGHWLSDAAERGLR
jgi:Fe-S cluster assembly protein SufD